MKFTIPLFMTLLLATSVAQSQSGTASDVPSIAIPKTTAVLVIQSPKQGVSPKQIMAVMPEEIQATVKLYLDGKIREWYSRGNGKGVVSWSRRRPRTRREHLWKRCHSPRNS